MKKIIVSLLFASALLFAAEASAQSFTFSNIQYWVGSGTNSVALVIAWNDGKTPDSLVWGYKWNTPVSGTNPTIYDMMQAIQSADSRFLFTPNPKYSKTVYSAFFDLTGSGGTPVVGKPINLGGQENGYPPYAGDHYKEGWFTGFWGELVGIGNPYTTGSWDSDWTVAHGVGVDTLSNGGWYGLSYSTDETNFTIPVPGYPTPVSIPKLTFAQWQTKTGASGGAGGTPRNDGVANLLKYLFDIDPSRPMNASDRAALPVLGMTSTSGKQYLTLTYRQNQLITGITVNVQISSDLQAWPTVIPDIIQQTGVDANTGDPIIEVEVQVPAGSPRNFLRISATWP